MTLEKQLIDASMYGDLDRVNELVEQGADVHAQEDKALREASNYGHTEVVKYLEEHGGVKE